jgi:MobA/MobL family
VAIYHNSVSVIKRSAGKSAVAAAAYRSGEKLTDERTGLTHDYTRKSGVDYSAILTPVEADWIVDRAELWNKVEAAEKRGDAQLAREITVAIPCELDREDKIKLVCDYAQQNYVDRGMIADINYHHLDGNNPHAHIMVTMRDLKIDEQGDVSFGKKNREWNDWQDAASFTKNRENWATIANQYLVDAGYPDIQIDHRSNADRRIEIIPQIHLGAEATAMRKKGIASELGDRYDQIEAANISIRKKLEQIYQSESATRDLEDELAEFDRQITPSEIPKIPTVTAKKRDRSQFYEKIESIPKEVTKPSAPEVKERITLYQKTDPQLVRSILETAQELGIDFYQAGDYHVKILPKQIEVKYHNNLAMIIGISIRSGMSMLIDQARDLNYYEQGLGRSIDVLVADLQQQQEQAQAKEPEQLKPLGQMEPELKLSHDIIDDSEIIVDDDSEIIIIENPKINVTKSLASKNLSHGSGWNR